MKTNPLDGPGDGDHCEVIGGTHKGKSGTVRDIRASKAGHVTIMVVQADGNRFKTLAKNVLARGASEHEQHMSGTPMDGTNADFEVRQFDIAAR